MLVVKPEHEYLMMSCNKHNIRKTQCRQEGRRNFTFSERSGTGNFSSIRASQSIPLKNGCFCVNPQNSASRNHMRWQKTLICALCDSRCAGSLCSNWVIKSCASSHKSKPSKHRSLKEIAIIRLAGCSSDPPNGSLLQHAYCSLRTASIWCQPREHLVQAASGGPPVWCFHRLLRQHHLRRASFRLCKAPASYLWRHVGHCAAQPIVIFVRHFLGQAQISQLEMTSHILRHKPHIALYNCCSAVRTHH